MCYLVDVEFTALLSCTMLHSDPGLATMVVEGIAQVDGKLKKSDPGVEAKGKEIAKLNKEFAETLGKLV